MRAAAELQRSQRRLRSGDRRHKGDGRSSSSSSSSDDYDSGCERGEDLRTRRPSTKRSQSGRSRHRRQHDNRPSNDRRRRRDESPTFAKKIPLDSMAPSGESYISSVYNDDGPSHATKEDDEDLVLDLLYERIRNGHGDVALPRNCQTDSAAESDIATVHAVPPARTVSMSTSTSDSSKSLVKKREDKKQSGHQRIGRDRVRREREAQPPRGCPVPVRPVIVGGPIYDGSTTVAPDGTWLPPPSSGYLASIYEEIEPKSRPAAGATALLLTLASLAAIAACLTITVLNSNSHLSAPAGLHWQVNKTAREQAMKVASAALTSNGSVLTTKRVAGYTLKCLDTTTCLCNLERAWGNLATNGDESAFTVQQAGHYHVISKVTFKEQQRRCGCAEVSLIFSTGEKNMHTVSTAKMTIDRESASPAGSDMAAFTVHQEFTRTIFEPTRVLVNASCLQVNVCQVAVDVKSSVVSLYYLGPLLPAR